VLFVLSFRQKNGKEANLKSPKRRNLKWKNFLKKE
jgi:hypothetical protein